jgi:hypothetical protein
MFFGSIIFRFLGISLRFLLLNGYNMMMKKPFVPYRKFWDFPYTEGSANAAHEMRDIFLGFFVLLFILFSTY